MAVEKKIQSRITAKKPAEQEVKPVEEKAKKIAVSEAQVKEEGRLTAATKKVCFFCKTKTEPVYWDATNLRKHLNDRGRIVSRSRHGTCAKHQRRVSREIKRARHLALLPFVVRV